jgi:hypothetical protein
LAGAALCLLSTLPARADNWSTGTAGQITSGQGTRVGVGGTPTSSPAAELEVIANTSGRDGLIVNQVGTTGAIARFRQNGSTKVFVANSGAVGIGTGGTAPNAGLVVKNPAGLGVIANFQTSTGNSLFEIDEGGDIFARAQFHVTALFQPNSIQALGDITSEGNITAQGKVTATGGLVVKNWSMEVPDYVFDGGQYQPMSLQDVDAFVKKNKHLPEMPSAQEMKESGLDVAEMNLRLLKKVEELTLYVIEQDRKIQDLSARVR